jgi:hypothetical protein
MLLLSLLSSIPAAAQFLWQRAVGTATHDESAEFMIPAAGGYVTLGRVLEPPVHSLYLSKVNHRGDTLWTRRQFLRRSGAIYPQSLLEDGAGNLVTTVRVFDPSVMIAHGLLVKFTPGGDTLWTHRLTPMGESVLTKLVLGNDGNYVSIGSVGNVPMLFKFSPAGVLLWGQPIPYSASRDGYLQNMVAVPGGYLLVSSPNLGNLKSKYITVNEQGGYQFERSGSLYYDYSLKLDSQGDVLAIGGNLTKRTAQGDSLWSYSYQQFGRLLGINQLAELPGGGYLLGGQLLNGFNSHDVGLAVVDHDGRLLRDTLLVRRQSDDNVAGVALSPAGDYVVAVGADSNGPIGGGDQLVFSYRSWARLLPTRPAQAAARGWQVAAYPNPTAGEVTLVAADAGGLRGQWTLYDGLGRTLRTGQLPGLARGRLSLAGQPPGLYLLRIYDERQNRTQTLRIEKIDN